MGALLYLALNTRPDILYAVGVLARFNTNPIYRARKALIRLLLYLRSTPTIGLKFYGNELNLFGYSDADWAGDLDSRRSTTGYVVYAAGGPIACRPILICVLSQPVILDIDVLAEFVVHRILR